MNTPFPDWFDELAQLEAEAKGVLSDFPLIINGRETRFTFYDPACLRQDIEAESGNPYIRIDNLVVLPRVSKENILLFVQDLSEADADGKAV